MSRNTRHLGLGGGIARLVLALPEAPQQAYARQQYHKDIDDAVLAGN
jgi:hypothetical protein